MSISDVLRKYQGKRTQTEYAALLGVSQGYLSAVYSGLRNPGFDILRGFARAFPSAKAAKEIAEALRAQPEAVPA